LGGYGTAYGRGTGILTDAGDPPTTFWIHIEFYLWEETSVTVATSIDPPGEEFVWYAEAYMIHYQEGGLAIFERIGNTSSALVPEACPTGGDDLYSDKNLHGLRNVYQDIFWSGMFALI